MGNILCKDDFSHEQFRERSNTINTIVPLYSSSDFKRNLLRAQESITTLKVMFVGAQSIGKTKFIEKVMHNLNQANKVKSRQSISSTLEPNYSQKLVLNINQGYKVGTICIDTPGQKGMRVIVKQMSSREEFNAIVICYSIEDKNSFDEVQKFVDYFKDVPNCSLNLMALKSDLTLCREVTNGDGQKQAKLLRMGYYEVSSENNSLVNESYEEIIKSAISKLKE